MLNQWIQSLLSSAINRDLRRREERARAASPPSAVIPVLAPGGLVLGHEFSDEEPQAGAPVTLSPEQRRRHVYVLGATGTGKSNLLLRLIESDIAAGRSFCVVDLRGDLVDRILPRLSAAGDAEHWRERLLLIDLRHEEDVVGFNPLVGPGDAYGRAFHVLEVLRQQSDSWGVQLEETLRNCLIALAETGGTLLEIEMMLCNASFRAATLAKVQDRYVQSFFQRFDQLSAEQRLGWSMPVLNKVTPLLAIPRLRRFFGGAHTVSLQKTLDRRSGQVILVSLAVDRLHQAAYLVGGLLVSAIQNAIMARVDLAEGDRIPVNLYVDEFETMASEQFETFIAEGRRFGLGLCLSHQNLSQMPTRLREVLLNNAHTQIYFQTGAGDAAQLAREVSLDLRRDALQRLLTQQRTGEALIVQRGDRSRRIRVALSQDPAVSPALLAGLRQASWQAYGRTREEVEKELEQRRVTFERPAEPAPDAKKSAEALKPKDQTKEEDYEVRHRPRRGKPGQDKK
ncbi:hypothetical protein CCAX7_35160 [Capsulimonas corticalis]|uniref:Uncharacterized protein n=1 Tax=Capsulimonas corticalis TaxID=2219043 RepID=A0A402CY75_9BACT|nr:helicase HerA-like domain-containing protein [Capsulimonas corticalis]BDI31465.1 hypothetical protein CCAX7_35160 [Capsulimonas corticalis]